jgi:glycerophosphoryl diester phosphodiesterase
VTVVTVYAHRGASVAERENTVAAFRRAVDMGADGVELDVRRSADGALVVHHDPHLADGRAIVELPAASLPDHVPLLDVALDACRGVVVNVEIKNLQGDPDFDPDDSLVAPVLAACAGHDVIVSSFNLRTIDRVQEADPSIPTAFLVMIAPDRDVAGRVVDRCRRHGHSVLHPHHYGVTEHLVDLCRANGIAVNTWTVDDPDRMRQLAALGVDGIVTNVPDVALATLRVKG